MIPINNLITPPSSPIRDENRIAPGAPSRKARTSPVPLTTEEARTPPRPISRFTITLPATTPTTSININRAVNILLPTRAPGYNHINYQNLA